MNFKTITPDETLSLFAKTILVFEKDDANASTVLPFFADGYPGIIYQQTQNGLSVSPHNKRMPALFLYGQTIQPVELLMDGPYKLIIIQLYPFVLKSLLGINPKDLNDDCFDLTLLTQFKTSDVVLQLKNAKDINKQIEIITLFLSTTFQRKKESIDYKIRQAIHFIITHHGKLPIKEIRKKLNVPERTFERRFIAQAGLSPKQFSKIIRFKLSLNQLTEKEYGKLTDIVFENGFADQSHFIRTFKNYTGNTPRKFLQRLNKPSQ